MDPSQKEQTAAEEIAQLETEVAGLDRIAKQSGAEGMRTLWMGCWPLILTTICALGFWLLPRPIPTAYSVVLAVIGGIGTIFLVLFASKASKQAKTPEENKKFMDMLAQLEEKRKRLKVLKKSGE